MPHQAVSTNEAPLTKRSAPDFTDQLIQPFNQLRTEVDRLFNGFPYNLPTLDIGRMSFAAPAIEVTETEKQYKISAELAGMEPEDVEVTLDDGILRIAGEKKLMREENERGYHVAERSYGSFKRLIELPQCGRGSKVKAKFKNGLLTLTVPKNGKVRSKAQRVPIEKQG